MQCPICDKDRDEIKYGTIDASTGFFFCDDHFYDAKSEMVSWRQDLSDWLMAIASTRKKYQSLR